MIRPLKITSRWFDGDAKKMIITPWNRVTKNLKTLKILNFLSLS